MEEIVDVVEEFEVEIGVGNCTAGGKSSTLIGSG